ncbi:Mediator of RNA polymerase II transcription subunit 11 [Datura stramonium]|uniref:Mediator of RNA polymerase II transcription subunit 11 n=1 Tax=Datura stramonium TaxID=4076 RepID=A0ABS8WY11_DATST|nr:Mediator of RNA polymerase II transcription subunit 11 [Datura stramonium]
MDSQRQNTSLERLQNVEKKIVRVVELEGGVMDEMENPSGPRKELINNYCSEFMQLIKDIQVIFREEIKSACEYHPFEKCDYVPRISNEICCKKLEHIDTFGAQEKTCQPTSMVVRSSPKVLEMTYSCEIEFTLVCYPRFPYTKV